MTDYQKVYDPRTGVYLGVLWSRRRGTNGERIVWYAEDRAGRNQHFYDEGEARAWLTEQARAGIAA